MLVVLLEPLLLVVVGILAKPRRADGTGNLLSGKCNYTQDDEFVALIFCFGTTHPKRAYFSESFNLDAQS